MKVLLALSVLALWLVGAESHLLHYWSPWGGWSSCNATCGFGVIARNRTCHVRCREEEPDDETVGSVAGADFPTSVVCSKGQKDSDIMDCFQRACPASCTCYASQAYQTYTGSRDVVAAIDGSGSISDQEFGELQQVLAKFLRGLGGHDWFGMVLYSTQVHLTVPMTVDHLQSNNSIASLPHPKGTTNTAAAIQEMHRLLKGTGRNVPKVGVVFTDGASNDKQATIAAARAAKQDGVQICAIGVGSNVDQDELNQISSPTCRAVQAPTFSQLRTVGMSSLMAAVSTIH